MKYYKKRFFQFTGKGGDTSCILNFKTKRVKEFRTLETDRQPNTSKHLPSEPGVKMQNEKFEFRTLRCHLVLLIK